MKYPQLVSMPSAVSDWLEEQLEARGIDAVVYTRYILSLLHSDTVDVIYSDEDLHFSHLKKEVRRSGGSRKRFRRSADWWKYAQADAEKLKRSAAVECLMSASEQTCGIESLIDELCEKLNEIKSDAHHTDPPTRKSNPELQQVSPQELANRYYAAFPPLNPNTSASPSKLISLIPKWIPSPKKKPAIGVNRKQNHRSSYEDTMKVNIVGRRFGACFPNRSNNKKDVRQAEIDWNMSKKARTENVPKLDDSNNLDWNMTEDANLYDDLPVDIKELLDDSPTPHDDTVEMMNLANMRDTGRRGFIPCGTNITSSIWSNEAAMEEDSNALFDNKYNAARAGRESPLDFPYPSSAVCNIDWSTGGDFAFVRENEANALFENAKTNFWDIPTGRWSEDSGCFEDELALGQLTRSFAKLDHKKEVSAFAEVLPSNSYTCRLTSFSKVIGSRLHRDASLKTVDFEKEKDDLLTSTRSHFRPINEKVDTYLQGEYADGATFAVSNNWDKINYRRTESGALYIENDYGVRKKYCEYKVKNGPTSADFVLKFAVCQNDKACQTEESDAEVEAINAEPPIVEGRRGGEKTVSYNCTCRTLATDTDHSLGCCLVHPARPDSSTALSEVVWQQRSCDKCNGASSLWNTNKDGLESKELGWQFGTMSKIWSGGEVCHSCLGRPASTLQHSKLREDVSHDGDQLLSDLSTIQKNYMEESSLPATESTCDISDLLLPHDRKRRRHSFVSNNSTDGYWSFTSRLEKACLIQISRIHTLRSVTL